MSLHASGAAPGIAATRRRGRSAGGEPKRHVHTNESAHQVVARLEREIKIAGARRRNSLPAQALANQAAIARRLWRASSFIDALPQLLSNDPALRDRCINLQRIADRALQESFEELIRQGHMRPLEPRATLSLSRACRLIWLSWLRAEHMANPEALEPSIPAIHRGLSLMVTVWTPYFTIDLRKSMDIALAHTSTR